MLICHFFIFKQDIFCNVYNNDEKYPNVDDKLHTYKNLICSEYKLNNDELNKLIQMIQDEDSEY